MSPTTDLMTTICARSSPLISADELEALIGTAHLKLFDVRGTWSSPARGLPDEYGQSHIPGAVFLDWTKHFIDQKEVIGLASVADKAGAEQAFRALGINEDDLVVLYDGYHHMQAGRIWWAMRYWGFSNVRVLNGGWKYWTAQGKPVSMDVPQISTGTFEPIRQSSMRASIGDVIATREEHCLIDARGAVNFAGKPGEPRTGHIPGAVNVPFSAFLDDVTGLFLEPDGLTAQLNTMAPDWRDKPIMTSCGSGYAATVALLALSEVSREARLFDGSFSVWKQDPNRPIAQSPSV